MRKELVVRENEKVLIWIVFFYVVLLLYSIVTITCMGLIKFAVETVAQMEKVARTNKKNEHEQQKQREKKIYIYRKENKIKLYSTNRNTLSMFLFLVSFSLTVCCCHHLLLLVPPSLPLLSSSSSLSSFIFVICVRNTYAHMHELTMFFGTLISRTYKNRCVIYLLSMWKYTPPID